MISLKNISVHLISGCAIAFALSSCGEKQLQQDLIDLDDGNVIEMTFDLNVGTASRVGSADVADLEDVAGSYEENYIDPKQIHVYISDNDSYGGYLQGEVPLVSAYRLGDSTYRIKVATDKMPESSEFRVIVTANWPYTPTKLTASMFALCVGGGSEFTYEYGSARPEGGDAYYIPSEEHPMPMFGIKKFVKANLSGRQLNLGTVYMIRSMAKIIVKSTCEDHEPYGDEIESVTLKYCYNVGMCGLTHPSNYDSTETMEILDNNDQTLNIPGSCSSSTYGNGLNSSHPLTRIADVPFRNIGNNKYVLYVPSYNNTLVYTGANNAKLHSGLNSACVKSYLTLRMKNRDKDYTLEFADSDGIAFNLCRNYVYIYDVSFSHSVLTYLVTRWGDFTSGDIVFN